MSDYQLPEGYKQTEIGVIPEDWEIYPLVKLASQPIQNGVFTNPFKKGRGCKLINVGDLYSSIPIDLDNLEFFDADQSEIKRFGVSKGDVFFTRSSLTPDGIAHCNIYDGTENNVVFDCHIIRFRPNTNLLIPNFFFRYCVTSVARKYLVTHSKTTTMTTIDQGVISKLLIPLPPLPEQHAIAQALSDVDALIAALDKLIAKKRDLKTATMQQLLTGKKRLPGFGKGQGYKESEIGLIPEDWDALRLGNIAPLQRGFDLPTSQLKKGNYPVVYSNGIINHHSDFMANAPGVVTGRSGTIGNVHYVSENYWPHNTALWVTKFICSNPKYVYYLYKSVKLERFGSGSGVPTLNRNDVHDWVVAIPKIEEQRAIALVLSDMDNAISLLESRLAKTKAIKQGMMQELLTGRTRLV